jgi:hypothetical protein
MQGCAGMKGRRIARKKIHSFGNQQVRREMQNFLRALNSYPDYFSKHPGISFEQHHGKIIEAAKSASRRGASNVTDQMETDQRLAGGIIPFIRR